MEKVLIIDDSLVQAYALRRILDDSYEVEVCQSGREGLVRAKAGGLALILLDVIMPELDGFEVLARLKNDGETKDIPVILITGLSDVGNEEKGLVFGAVDYIVKPFNASIVRARVRTHTQLYAFRRAMEHLAMLDALTGIPNRRSYDERSRAEWFRAARDQKPLSMALLDIDFFKQYNDRYGHPKGDDVLRIVAGVLRSQLCRPGDFCARYGGEEFVLLFPSTDAAGARHICEEICHGIERLCIPHEASWVGRFLTVSIGGATAVPAPGENYEAVFKRVDEMLYRAKEGGRNAVVWYAPEGDRGQGKTEE